LAHTIFFTPPVASKNERSLLPKLVITEVRYKQVDLYTKITNLT
jgi:hypothetical protein